MNLVVRDNRCLNCGFYACICDVPHPEGTCPDKDCHHSLGQHSDRGCGAKNGHDEYCDCTYVPDLVVAALVAETVHKHRCPTHKRYAAKRAPLSTCERCWRLWIKVSDL